MSTTILADRVGFEPTVELTSYDGLANRWFKPLTQRSVCYWCGWRDSNSHPEGLVSKTSVATITPHPHFNFGWGSRVRTRHLLIQSQTFYQLNYPPKKTEVYQGDETRTGTLGHKLLVRNERLELPTVCV
jgi:hypothetical protein